VSTTGGPQKLKKLPACSPLLLFGWHHSFSLRMDRFDLSRVPKPPPGSNAIARVLLGAAGLAYIGYNGLFNVKGGQKGVVFNRYSGIKKKVPNESPPWQPSPPKLPCLLSLLAVDPPIVSSKINRVLHHCRSTGKARTFACRGSRSPRFSTCGPAHTRRGLSRELKTYRWLTLK
jgi:hypothetical protein